MVAVGSALVLTKPVEVTFWAGAGVINSFQVLVGDAKSLWSGSLGLMIGVSVEFSRWWLVSVGSRSCSNRSSATGLSVDGVLVTFCRRSLDHLLPSTSRTRPLARVTCPLASPTKFWSEFQLLPKYTPTFQRASHLWRCFLGTKKYTTSPNSGSRSLAGSPWRRWYLVI